MFRFILALALFCAVNGATLQAAIGDYVENWRGTGYAGIDAELVTENGNLSALIDADQNVFVYDWGTEWPFGSFDEITTYFGIEENGRFHMWRDQAFPLGGPVVPAGSGANIPDIGIDVAEYIGEAIGTMAAVAVAAIGGYVAFCLAVRALQWVSIALGYEISDDYVPDRDLSELEWHQMTPFERQWLEREWADDGRSDN